MHGMYVKKTCKSILFKRK